MDIADFIQLLIAVIMGFTAILYFEKNVDRINFLCYFRPIIGEVYNIFMDSILFNGFEERIENYPNLSKLFNSLGRSVKYKYGSNK